MGRALTGSSRLVGVEIQSRESVYALDSSVLEFTKQLKDATHLQTVAFDRRAQTKMDEEVLAQFFHHLCASTSLHTVNMLDGDFYGVPTPLVAALELNRVGRAYLRERPNDRWQASEVLGAVRDNLDCLYFHVRENPGIVASWRQ